MAYSGDFTASQGANISNIILTDTSTGSDPSLTGRTVYLYQTSNALLGGVTFDWPLSSGSTLTISNILVPWDFSLNIVVTWQSSSPIPGSTYSKNHIATFTGNSNTFAYSLLQQISSNQAITRNTNYLNLICPILRLSIVRQVSPRARPSEDLNYERLQAYLKDR